MKVLLVYPYFLDPRPGSEDIRPMPMGLYWVAAVLMDHGYEVELIDWHDAAGQEDAIEAALLEKRPDVVGFSVLHANRWGALDIAGIVKRVLPETRVVFGGVGATFLWRHFLTHFPQVDYVILGEGEYSFLALLRWLERDRRGDPASLPGLAYRAAGSATRSATPPPTVELDKLPLPASYFSYQHLSLTRGCPWNCSFCGSPAIWNRQVRSRSADHFVAEMQLLYRRGVRFFYVSDDTFTLDKVRVIEICQKILALKMRITWMAISRVSTVDEEVLYWMRLAGCIQISYGVESGSEAIRQTLNKPLKTVAIKRAFQLTVSHGILARAYFIYGSPGETWDTIQASIDLINEIKPLAVIFYILDIFPGTALYRDFCRRTGTTDDIWLQRVEDIMYFQTDDSLDRETVLAFGERLRSEYFRRLPSFALSLSLDVRRELRPFHADFLSRLAMTFSHGDYAENPMIPGAEKTARQLYRKALEFFPEPSAYLGLAVLYQKEGKHRQVVELLRGVVEKYPDIEALHMCLGVSLMNLDRLGEALAHFLPFGRSPQALRYAAQCYRALGQHGKADALEQQLDGR